jgi:hypothetical protein
MTINMLNMKSVLQIIFENILTFKAPVTLTFELVTPKSIWVIY